jgi:hypothetical protein
MTIARPKLITPQQFAWLERSHAYHSGCEYISQRGDYDAMRRWSLLHGLSPGQADAQAQDCAMHWYERQLATRPLA